MPISVALSVAGGLVAGTTAFLLDRRLNGRFAESAGYPAESARTGVVVALYLFASPPIVYLLLSVREQLVPGAVYRAVVVAVLLWIASIDWRWRIIPNRIVYPAFLVALILSPLAQAGPLLHAYEYSLFGLAAAGGVFLLFFLLSILIYHRAGAFGLGDVKLAGFVGVALGFPSALAAVFIATFAGAIFAIAWGVASGDRKAGFPYGPAIVIGAILAMLIAPTGR